MSRRHNIPSHLVRCYWMLSQYYYKLQTTIGYFSNLIAFFNVWINLFPIIPDKSSFKNFFLRHILEEIASIRRWGVFTFTVMSSLMWEVYLPKYKTNPDEIIFKDQTVLNNVKGWTPTLPPPSSGMSFWHCKYDPMTSLARKAARN